jgi:hypothetical protein
MIRQRSAPSADRTASSRRRTVARVNNRLAMFAQQMGLCQTGCNARHLVGRSLERDAGMQSAGGMREVRATKTRRGRRRKCIGCERPHARAADDLRLVGDHANDGERFSVQSANMALLAPIPSASISTATAAKRRCVARARTA